jgi:type II secretory pathway component PulF
VRPQTLPPNVQSLWSYLYRLPVSQFSEVVFAEALSQALYAGIPIAEAIRITADTHPSRRISAGLREMAWRVRTGTDPVDGLERTGLSVSGDLLAVFEVAGDRGRLPDFLKQFAAQRDPAPWLRLADSQRRPAEVTRFAACLAELLRDNKLSPSIVFDAGLLAAGRDSKFANRISGSVDDMRQGTSLADSLKRGTQLVDRFLIQLLAAQSTRHGIHSVLARAVGQQPGPPPTTGW